MKLQGYSVLVGPIVAVIIFFLGKWIEKRREIKKEKKKYVSMLTLIAVEIERNCNLEGQVHAYFFVGIIPTFSLSLFYGKNLLEEIIPVSLNYNLLFHMFRKFNEHEHIQYRINRLQNLWEKKTDFEIQGEKEKVERVLEVFEREKENTLMHIRDNILGTLRLYNEIVEEVKKHGKKKDRITRIEEKEYLDLKYSIHQNEVKEIAIIKNIDLSTRSRYYSSEQVKN